MSGKDWNFGTMLDQPSLDVLVVPHFQAQVATLLSSSFLERPWAKKVDTQLVWQGVEAYHIEARLIRLAQGEAARGEADLVGAGRGR